MLKLNTVFLLGCGFYLSNGNYETVNMPLVLIGCDALRSDIILVMVFSVLFKLCLCIYMAIVYGWCQ